MNNIAGSGPVLALLLMATATAADLQVMNLKCEHRADPLGIDTPRPRLSWRLESSRRGEKQTAYRVLVAESPKMLADDKGNLWDSGRVESDRSIQVEYAGLPLQSNRQYFWKVKVWDIDGNPSAWSVDGMWSMGLLKPEDWEAHWIGSPRAVGEPFPNARWIWHREADWESQRPIPDPPNVLAGATRYFSRILTLPDDCRIRRARLTGTIDNSGEIRINGAWAGVVPRWEHTVNQDVTGLLRAGKNEILVRAVNGGNGPNPAGFVFSLIVETDQGRTVELHSDDSWRSKAVAPGTGWAPALDPAGWQRGVVLPKWGDDYWNRHVRKPQSCLPIFRKDFVVRRPVARAMVYMCGLGHHRLQLNGQQVGNRFLDPAWSVYEKTAYYTSDDVTEMLRPGENAFGVMLGKGFYNTEGDRRIHGVYTAGPPKFILQAILEYRDGSRETIISDPTWRWTGGPITHSAIQSGGDYDARRLPDGWSAPNFDDSTWSKTVPIESQQRLMASSAPPIRALEEFKPVRIDEPEPRVFVYDFGQNASAIPRLRVQGKAGQVIRLTAAEQRHGQSPRTNDGRERVNPAGVGHQYWEYTLRGGEGEVWSPPFTYAGFQYLELTGAVPAGRPNPDDLPVVGELVSIHIRNVSPVVGSFACSNPLLNKTDCIIDWAVRSNLSHVLTDCPHREKLGWLEVSYLMGPSIAMRYDIASFYSKVTRDIRDSQSPEGEVYTVAPNYPSFSGGFRYSPCWGAAGVMVPWLLYQQYGDLRILEENYDAMKRFVDFMEKTSGDLIARPGLGDWYDYGHGESMGPSRFTPVEQTATATFHDCTRIVAKTARLLGKESDTAAYRQLAEKIQRKFNATYFNGTDQYKNHGSPQTANSMALIAGLVDPAHVENVVERIVTDIRARDNQQTAGDVGFVYLVRALARHGRSDVLFDVATRHNLGSYGFIVDRGWTSMPEAWDAGTGASMNHCMLGHIQEWFYHHLAGIQCDPAGPGFKKIIIRPEVVGDLTWVKAHHDSMYGRIAVDWRRDGEKLTLNVTIPANTTATIFVPGTDARNVTESGKSAEQVEGVKLLRTEADVAVYQVGSGTYRFEVQP